MSKVDVCTRLYHYGGGMDGTAWVAAAPIVNIDWESGMINGSSGEGLLDEK